MDFPYERVEQGIELKPCPFCGSTQDAESWEDRVRCIQTDAMGCSVVCGRCNSKGVRLGLPDHIDDAVPLLDEVADVFGLTRNLNERGADDLWLWMAQFVSKCWNTRREPRQKETR